jgi:hypothetical protein
MLVAMTVASRTLPETATERNAATDELGERGEKGLPAGNLESVRMVRSWLRNLPAPRFKACHRGSRMADYLQPGLRTLLTGDPIPGGRVATLPEGVSAYTEGRYPRVTGHGGEVSWAAQWLGEGDYTPAQAAQVWAVVEQAVQAQWRDQSARLYGTPATTGRDLWARTIREGEAWPVLAPEVQSLIRSTAGQGRMEVFARRADWLPVLYEYDARMAYVALMRNLPIGEPVALYGHAAIDDWQRGHQYNEGRFLVTWEAPRGWAWPGLLPAHGTGERDWEWPLTCAVQSWCGGAELWVALQHGWTVRYHEAHVWHRSCDPLRTWTRRLLAVLAEVNDELADDAELRKMGRAAVRAILLHTVGAFHGAPRKINHVGAEPPEGAQGIRALSRRYGGELYAWYTVEPPAWPELVHPEWTATIWGRARARLAYSHRGEAGFLTLPPEQLVAVRTDAIYTTAETGWTDDNGDPGHYTLRGVYKGPWAWPTKGTDVLKIAGRK